MSSLRVPDELPDQITAVDLAEMMGGITVRAAASCLSSWGFEPQKKNVMKGGIRTTERFWVRRTKENLFSEEEIQWIYKLDEVMSLRGITIQEVIQAIELLHPLQEASS